MLGGILLKSLAILIPSPTTSPSLMAVISSGSA